MKVPSFAVNLRLRQIWHLNHAHQLSKTKLPLHNGAQSKLQATKTRFFRREPDKLSKWCTVFDKTDLRLLEYAEDIHILYKSGYGSDYNPKLGCPIVGDLYQRIESATKTAKQPKIVAHFTHSTAFHQFITALGVYKDEILPNGVNYADGGDERRWKTALFGASSTNFVGILYKCAKTPEKYYVQFLLDENPFDLTENCTKGLCPWSAFKRKYEETVQTCDLSFCRAIPKF